MAVRLQPLGPDGPGPHMCPGDFTPSPSLDLEHLMLHEVHACLPAMHAAPFFVFPFPTDFPVRSPAPIIIHSLLGAPAEALGTHALYSAPCLYQSPLPKLHGSPAHSSAPTITPLIITELS